HKDQLLSERDQDITNLKNEFNNLSQQLRDRLSELATKDTQISGFTNQITEFNLRIQEQLESLRHKDQLLSERENELNNLNNELNNLKNDLNNLSQQLQQKVEEILRKDNQLVDKDTKISSLNTQINDFSQELQLHIRTIEEKNRYIAEKEKELRGIYDSEGFRFVLRPLWTVLWNIKGVVRFIKRRSPTVFWFATTLLLTPVFAALSLCFYLEYASWFILRPFLKIIPLRKRKAKPLVDIQNAKISLVIPNYNGLQLIKECLTSVFALEEFANGKNEILVVDDGSTDESAALINYYFPQVRLIKNGINRGFGFTCNRGVRLAKNEIVVLINNDIILTKDCIKPLLAHLAREDVFVSTPKLYGWDRQTFVWGMHMGRFEEGYVRLWNEAETKNGDKISQASPSLFAIGGAMVFRKSDFLWLGGFDKIFRPNCWEDIDISYRAWKRGLKVIYEPTSLMYHKGRATLSYERPKEIKNELLFTWKNITSSAILKDHLNLLPMNLFKYKMPFLRGFFWALNFLPEMLEHRFSDRRYTLEPSDEKIFNSIMHYYRSFSRRGFRHLNSEKPTVLLVSRFPPYPLTMGGKIRMHNLCKLLSGKYNFILLSLIDHEDELQHIPALKEVFSEVFLVHTTPPSSLSFTANLFYPERYKIGYSWCPDLIEKLKDLQRTQAIDIVHIESNELLYLADYVRHIPIVYTEHDVSFLAPGKSYYKREGIFVKRTYDYLKRFNFHVSQLKKLNKIITLSREDERVLKAFFPDSDISLVPTGTDLGHFTFESKPRANKKLIYVGHYRHYPNEEAVVHFAQKIFPLIREKVPEAELLIVGSNPTPPVERLAKEKNVFLIGEVPSVRPYLEEAAVFVSDIHVSAGIKGKVLEAMAAGVPVVSTRSGCFGIDARHEKEILIADSPREFAKQVVRLLDNEWLREKLSINARLLVEEKFDWLKIINKLDRVYKSTLFDLKQDDFGQNEIEKVVERANRFIEDKIDKIDVDLVSNAQKGPEELHIELTYRCNSKCIMCDLWDYNKRRSVSPNEELSLDEIKRLVDTSSYLRKTKVVVLSGGEPFVRNDIVDIGGFFSKEVPQASLGILTNGIETERIVSNTKEILDRFQPKALWVGSSLDGVGDSHDVIRGKDGAFTALYKTIQRFKKELPSTHLSLTFTLTPYNIDQLLQAKQFAQREGLDFFAQFVVPKDWTESGLRLAKREIMQILQELLSKTDYATFYNSIEKVQDAHLLSQLYYWSNLAKYQVQPRRFFKKCISGAKFAMLTPYGDLFFCPILKNRHIGNIREENFDKLWVSNSAEGIRSYIKEGKCHCCLVCIIFPLLEKVLVSN
ncbi:MAG: glycosyltransferase, partial [Candidatus Omnitrophica bacterium]|nr:glycosyltransferase [Candidatus Omnitrophota bacterium]